MANKIVNLLFTAVSVSLTYGADCDDIDWVALDLGAQLNFNEFRALNGSNNNLNNPNYGAQFSETVRCVNPVYADGFNALTGETRPNPRELSNVLSKQDPEEDSRFVNNRDLTNFAWQWGQFIDHDITLISEDRNDNDFELDIDIYVPCCDPTYDKECVCDADITMNVFRTRAFEGTGTQAGNPRNQFNDITAFIDGSNVYGSDIERAYELREFDSGLMKVSYAHNGDELLPLNENHIVNEPNEETRFFIGGDVRVNEQLGLLTIHTLFVRAHNKIAEYVYESVETDDTLDDIEKDELTYQYTKLILTAIKQKITYEDWLPTLFGRRAINMFLPDYNGYDDTINPGICLIFASAAFRLGHTFLPQKLPRRNERCTFNDKHIKDIELRNAFFVPGVLKETPELLNEIVHGFSCTLANEVDLHITEGVRNFLFESAIDNRGERLFGVLDLVSLNLQRGRDHGIPNYNQVRDELGLDRIESFDDISDDDEVNENLRVLYDNDVDNIDLFIGLFAEKHLRRGSFGETVSKIVLSQFQRLRDGDRFYYENYIKDGELLDWIKSVTLKDIFEWTINEDIDLDNSDNIFQNEDARSIFLIPASAKAENKMLLNSNELSMFGDKFNVNDIRFIGLVLVCFMVFLFSIVFVCYYKCKKKALYSKYNQVDVSVSSDVSSTIKDDA